MILILSLIFRTQIWDCTYSIWSFSWNVFVMLE